MRYEHYVASTSAYLATGIAAITAAAYFLLLRRYFLVAVAALAAYVALDNTFCSSRAKKCGIDARGHYSVPVFLKKWLKR